MENFGLDGNLTIFSSCFFIIIILCSGIMATILQNIYIYLCVEILSFFFPAAFDKANAWNGIQPNVIKINVRQKCSSLCCVLYYYSNKQILKKTCTLALCTNKPFIFPTTLNWFKFTERVCMCALCVYESVLAMPKNNSGIFVQHFSFYIAINFHYLIKYSQL